MASLTRITDPKARVSLPKGFANSTVIIEQISDIELRIRKAGAPEHQTLFAEDSREPLSNRDRDIFLALLDKPPAANRALVRAVAQHRKDRSAIRKRLGLSG
jgi:hypothetical protein